MSDVWFVRTPTGEARMTLDELDAAFEAGTIGEQTQVREENALQWTTLGALLGGDEKMSAPVAPVAPVVPVVTPTTATQKEMSAPSVRPVAVDLDLDEAELKPKKTGVYVAIGVGALALAGLTFAVTQFGGTPAVEKVAGGHSQVAVVQPQAAIEEPIKVGLTDEQKKALAEKDKELAAKQAAKAEELREKREHQQSLSRPGQKSGPVFQKGGNKYDPLNQGL